MRQVRLAWAEPRGRFTTLFERLAIDVLRETDVKGATQILRISWDEAWEIKRRAVARGRARRRPQAPARLGVDETAIARGHDYLTLVCDLTTGTVEYLAEERKQASLDGYFTSLTPAQRAADPGGGDGHVGALRAVGADPRAAGRAEDRVRRVPHLAAHEQGGGQGPAGGASAAAGAGR